MSGVGAVAAGHEQTAQAATDILAAGGNAFDAVIAAHLAACVTEPVLASLGGGGFLLAHPVSQRPVIYDFFPATPLRQPDAGEELDFRPIHADFGGAVQEFQIGAASAAVPGSIAGLARIHADLGYMPMRDIIQPASRLAREGVEINRFQAFLSQVVAPIIGDNPAVAELFGASSGRLPSPGHRLAIPRLVDAFEAMASDGADWFYQGAPAQYVARQCSQGGGLLTIQDFSDYRVKVRKPLIVTAMGSRLLTNPVPACGGVLSMFLLQLLDQMGRDVPDADSHLRALHLAAAMQATSARRRDSGIDIRADIASASRMLDASYMQQAASDIAERAVAIRGTTHFSVADAAGNVASMTVSNGEGSGLVLADFGIQLNNVLGEEDLNPGGFHQWRPGARLASMMAPTVIEQADGTVTALGSGGSNRIRTALPQVIAHLLHDGMDLRRSINACRMHYEQGHLQVEPGYTDGVVSDLKQMFDHCTVWPEQNLYFGGVHAVEVSKGEMIAYGDPRRGGAPS
ncbi:MAG: gamma-glutamyltranspeptidase [Lysobacteraceae bacterium]|nr:MAG: gamma-glutamyltranspeptidase [Xanthomonadaceae bacterium]